MDCRPVGPLHVCYTFKSPEPLSKCMNALVRFNDTNVRNFCHFESTKPSDYSPLEYREGLYVVHSHVVSHSVAVYENEGIAREDPVIHNTSLSAYSYVLKIKPGMEARLRGHGNNRFILRGPLNFILRKFDIKLERTYGALAIHSLVKQKIGSYDDIMQLMTKATRNPTSTEYTKLLNFNLTDFRQQFTTKNDNLDQVMNEIRDRMTGLEELSKTVTHHESHLFRTTLMMIISLTSYLFQCLTTILFLSVIIREGHWRIFAPPLVTLNILDPVNADIIDILPSGARMIIESQEYLIYAQAAFVTVLIILFLLTFVMRTWGKVQLTVHEGVAELPVSSQRLAGRLSFFLVRQM